MKRHQIPDLMEREAEVFGNRTIAGFLSQVGAEEPSTSDQIVWSEQGRLHLTYNVTAQFGGVDGKIRLVSDVDGNTAAVATGGGIRVNDTILLAHPTHGTIQCIVTAINVGAVITDISVLPYKFATVAASAYPGTAVTGCTMMVYGLSLIHI